MKSLLKNRLDKLENTHTNNAHKLTLKEAEEYLAKLSPEEYQSVLDWFEENKTQLIPN